MSEPTKSATAGNESTTGFRAKPRYHVLGTVGHLRASGRLPATDRLSISIGLQLRNAAQLGDLLRAFYKPVSPRFRQYLTAERFAHEFGSTDYDYEAGLTFAETIREFSGRSCLARYS